MAKRVVGLAAGLLAASLALAGRPVGPASRSEADVGGVVSGPEAAERVLG
jgi:hypothetical protein